MVLHSQVKIVVIQQSRMFLYVSDPISALYVCAWNFMQHGYDMEHIKNIPNRAKCAERCHNNAQCVGFEYYPVGNKDCYLTKTPWQTVAPANTGGRWSCEKKGGILYRLNLST